MIMEKRQNILKPLLDYAGKRRALTWLSMFLSGVGQLLALMPFICIWAILREVLDVAPDFSAASGVTRYGWMAVGFAIASILVYFGALMCSHLAAFRIVSNMRKALLQHIMTLPIGFLDSIGSGKIRKWVQDSTESTETYLAHQLPDKAGMYATMAGLAVLMFLFDWRMGLLCLATVFLAFIVMVSLMTGPALKKKMAEYGLALDAMSNEAVEYVRGIPVVKTFGQSVFSFKRFKTAIDEYQKWVIAYTLQLRLPMTLYTVLVNSSFAVLIGITLVVLEGGSPSHGFLLNLLYYIIITPAIAVTLNRIMFASENEMIVAEALSKMDNILSIEPLMEPVEPKIPSNNDIELRNVHFRYPQAERNAVEGISLAIPAGMKIAFVGPSGGGKTTLASLIARFFDVSGGSISLGGVDIRDIGKKELMDRISFVFQDSRLLKTSILENVRMGRPTASREEVLEALRKAQCDDILEKLPQGVDTVIGTCGTYLSGGEQQRIAIARVMLKDSPVMILDEATAFADADNEVRVQQAFSELSSEGKTIIMIAHRLSSVTDTDCICLLEDGHITQQGPHEALLKKGGKYADMWKQYAESIKWNIK
ncbi:MAG: ABC transporter ATP-binding protein [Bacteroidales bacterium]|nr:ABC transporter ATP-binding protein [Bacteroidales bacterium]